MPINSAMKPTKAEMKRETMWAVTDLEAALRKNDPVRICETSRHLAGTVDYAWCMTELWTAEFVTKVLALLNKAADQTVDTPSHANVVPRIKGLKHRLGSLLVAREALTLAERH